MWPLTVAFPDKYVGNQLLSQPLKSTCMDFFFFCAFALPLPLPLPLPECDEIWLWLKLVQLTLESRGSFQPGEGNGVCRAWLRSPERGVHGNAAYDLNFTASNCILFSMDQLSLKYHLALSCLMSVVTKHLHYLALGNRSLKK